MKPIDRQDFWKERIDNAKKTEDRLSVYVTTRKDWQVIEENHKKNIELLIKDTDKVLDAGCGYGRLSEVIKNYTGVDFSSDFINWAREKYPDKTFIQGNLKDLTFKKHQFDWAICSSIKAMIINNLGQEEWDSILKELKRVAKKVLILEYEESLPYEIL